MAYYYAYRTKLSEFEESRRYEKAILMNITDSKPRPKIVPVRKRGVSINKEMSYKDILRDLYTGYLEDVGVRGIGYFNQLKIFDKWYDETGLEKAKMLVENMVLTPISSGSATREEVSRIDKLREEYFYVPEHNFKKLWN